MALEFVKLPFEGTHIIKDSNATWCGKNIFGYNSFELCSNSKKPCKKCLKAREEANRIDKEKATGKIAR